MWLWKRLTPEVRAYGGDFPSSAAGLYLLLRAIHLLGGDFAWGDRYVSTAVELVALLAVPLLMRYRALNRERSGKTIWRAGCH
jgi:hypothetical protein